jgi:hypothetical protein
MQQSKILYVYLLIKSKLHLGNFDRCFISLHWILDKVCSNKKDLILGFQACSFLETVCVIESDLQCVF